ncbi:hypothetical protein FYK55_10445 [Roseiconus nitratireducens]|uniref:Uncharacterized protein n=1 Tax=Roseiconus nitratireducens TaxID=2605748 RepID=A0A5M6D7W2_9BACT|nr:DUF6580 family putative transport protein [Roseiconus nitratireducens]KAA5543621.1 hypothetical protein FYK55_10445 [Roseiconus nitratireducens]
MIYLLTLAVVLTRFLPHPPNFACLGALGLFAGCYFAGRRALLVPAAALLISDIIGHAAGIPGMGFYNPMVLAATYLGVTLAVPLGRKLQQGSLWVKLPLASVAASTIFFIVSNFGVWLGPWYPATTGGLVACFTNAIPFYGYTLAGDLLFSGVMFGAFELSRRRFALASPALQSVRVASR